MFIEDFTDRGYIIKWGGAKSYFDIYLQYPTREFTKRELSKGVNLNFKPIINSIDSKVERDKLKKILNSQKKRKKFKYKTESHRNCLQAMIFI